MRKRIVTISIVGLVALLLLIFGIRISTTSHTPVKNARERYEKAIQSLPTSYTLSIDKDTTIKVSDKEYLESSLISLRCSNLPEDGPRIHVTETITSGSATTQVTESYIDGTLYLTVQDQSFSSKLTDEAARNRYIPATLNSALYEKCSGFRKNGSIEITFSSPIAAESWAVPTGAELISASAKAKLNNDNKLKSFSYFIEYYYGDAIISKEFKITVKSGIKNDLIAPENPDAFTPIDYIDGPVLLEKMCGLLLQENSIAARTDEYMYCGAFGDQRLKTELLEIRSLSPVDVDIATTVTQSNSSHGDTAITTTQVQNFASGAYTVSTNNEPAESNPAITEAYMREYCQNMLLGTLILPQYIQNVKFTTADNQFTVTYYADELFVQIITEDLCNTLYGDPTALTSRSTDHKIENIACTIIIDKATGLPVKAQIHYSGSYTIDDVPYPLSYEVTQSYAE